MTKDEALREAIDTLKSTKHGNCDFAWIDETLKKCTEALAQPPLPVQEPVAYDKTEMNSFVIDLYDKKMQEGKHGHYETMFYVVHQAIKRASPPLPVQPEPLEYWNAVEGWVKIDEVRKHFDAVNCGTIYKHGGEGRVPLYTTPPQRQWVGLTEEDRCKFAAAQYGWEDLCLAVEAKLKEKNHG